MVLRMATITVNAMNIVVVMVWTDYREAAI